MSAKDTDLSEFSNEEIRDEFTDRFGSPADEATLSDFDTEDIIEELSDRGELPSEEIDGLDEIADLIAEAARTSRHAARAYQLLRDALPDTLPALPARQSIIADRMKDAA